VNKGAGGLRPPWLAATGSKSVLILDRNAWPTRAVSFRDAGRAGVNPGPPRPVDNWPACDNSSTAGQFCRSPQVALILGVPGRGRPSRRARNRGRDTRPAAGARDRLVHDGSGCRAPDRRSAARSRWLSWVQARFVVVSGRRERSRGSVPCRTRKVGEHCCPDLTVGGPSQRGPSEWGRREKRAPPPTRRTAPRVRASHPRQFALPALLAFRPRPIPPEELSLAFRGGDRSTPSHGPTPTSSFSPSRTRMVGFVVRLSPRSPELYQTVINKPAK